MKELFETIKKTKWFFFGILLSAFLFALFFDLLVKDIYKTGLINSILLSLMLVSGLALVGLFFGLEERLRPKKDPAVLPSFLGEYLN